MAPLPEDRNNEVFKARLGKLWNTGYITDEEYDKLLFANRQYAEHLQQLEEERLSELKKQTELERERAASKEEVQPVQVKKEKSAEEIRERNITWSLILGVSLLLITGLIVATSQWEQMGPLMKVFSIAFVSLFFFGLSHITGKFLKITKTAFAFLTLGSLLIPIGILAIGYFELFGNYFSLFGEGRYLLGLMGTLLPLPLYIRIAFSHNSRLYVWISLVFLSLTAGFALGALPLSVDAFYMLLMLFNATLLLAYVRYRHNGKLAIFMKEVPLYAQLNLVLSTLLMLFFFESEVFYSFNLLLTASIYMAMVFVYRTKEYQFVFSVMIVYAVYQLVEHSPLLSVDAVVYALAGLIYLGFAYAFKNHTFVEKVFRYTSGVVSCCAFFYISYESILLRGEVESWLLLTAYAIITANYLLLSNLTKYPVFQYMTPLFFFITIWQLWELTEFGPLFLFMFLTASITLIYPGLWAENRWLKAVKESTFYASALVLGCSLIYGTNEHLYGYSSFMFFSLGILAYVTKRKTEIEDIKRTAIWIQPISWLLAAAVLYMPLVRWIPAYEDGLALPFHLALTGLILLAVHIGWKKAMEEGLSTAAFYTGQGTYILAMLLLINPHQTDTVFIRPLLLLIGIGVMYWLVQFVSYKILWGFVSVTVLGFYISLLDTINITTFNAFLIYMAFAPVVLLWLGEWGEKKWKGMRPYFYWLGHGIQPLIIALLLLNQIGNESVSPFLLLVPLSLYSYSALTAGSEWKIKLMLYAALTTLFLLLLTMSDFYNLLQSVSAIYIFLVTSVLITGIWAAVPHVWKKRIDWYIVPFSILGLYLIAEREGWWLGYDWILSFGYVLLILFFLHKRDWSIIRLIPLFLTLVLWEKAGADWDRVLYIIALSGFSLILLAAGRYFHKLLAGPGNRADAYSWIALLYIAYLNYLVIWEENVWLRVLPVVLLSIWFFVNAVKWAQPYVDKVFNTGGAASLYIVYLLLLHDYQTYIPDLIQAELQVLPLLGVLALMRKKTWQEFASAMYYIQFGAVLLIAAYLVVDAIQSHTIWDAWIIGGLSLISMIAGMQLRMKSYFFVGMGVLIFNVLYQTRPYWGNLPWWVYLLFAGFLLIGIASYNEWQKQQNDSSNKPVAKKMKRLWLAFKKWD
ncbi:hypothetical protein [Halobacillus massiliensis]|uniref:hypothetical protein n=1 Tax=Halobacillus massiliensis TaxID=1926286 RepID=UPI0009E24566|nr:hypothetical protein [Halobacillus massiliensis]